MADTIDMAYVRSHDEARKIVTEGDVRVAIALAVGATDALAMEYQGTPLLTPRTVERLAWLVVAAEAYVELCALGHRCGWDGCKAATYAYWLSLPEPRAQGSRHAHGQAVAVSLIMSGDAVPDEWAVPTQWRRP